MSFLRYRARRDDPITARGWNNVLAELDRRLGLPPLGSGSSKRSVAATGDIAFEISLSQGTGGTWAARFSRGLVAGYEPVIGKINISGTDPATGQPPALIVNPPTDIDPATGTGYVYARLTLSNNWGITKIEPVCLSAPPAAADRKWKAYKLLALLTRSPAGSNSAALNSWQAVEHNLGWAAIQRHSSGDARHLFWATS